MNLKNKKGYFFIILSGFISGVAFHSFVNFHYSVSLFIILLSFVLSLYYFLVKRQGALHFSHKYFFVIIFILSFGLGSLRLDISFANRMDSVLDEKVGTKITVEGTVTEEPDVRENGTRLIVSLDNKAKLLASVGFYPEFRYGDKVKLTGKLGKPKNFITESGSEFDYISYLAKDGIFYDMYLPNVELVSSGNGNLIKEKLFAFKNYFLGKIRSVVPEPQASLAGGLIVGAKSSLGKELQEDFRKTGIIHIVVLSGYNITIVATSVMAILAFLPSLFALIAGTLSIVAFGIMTGGSATVVRACIMALLALVATRVGRTYNVERALGIAGFAMILHNPQILIFDPSFQLSFLATYGLIFIAPLTEKYFTWVTEKFQLRQVVVATVTTQIFLLPFLLYKTGLFSVVALPVNLLVLAFIPITMFFGFLSGLVAMVSSFFAIPFGFIANILLSYELWVVNTFADMPFSAFTFTIPFYVVIVWYGVYGLVIWRMKQSAKI